MHEMTIILNVFATLKAFTKVPVDTVLVRVVASFSRVAESRLCDI